MCYNFRKKRKEGVPLLLTDLKMDPREAALLNPLQLAYVGDAVWEILVRQSLALRRLNVHHMHTESISRVNARAQAGYMLLLEGSLTEEELSIAQRGRNAHARHPSPRNQDPADYAEATAFEALIGYLYLTDQSVRLSAILDAVFPSGGAA